MKLILEQKEKPAKIKLSSNYPYTYVRVLVMKGLLLKKEDYHKLIKMSMGEIAKFLQDTQYREGFDKLAVNYKGVELVERVLNYDLVKTFSKLRRISQEELRLLINAYLKREDFWNIKTILRGKYVGKTEKEIEDMIIPSGALTEEFLVSLIKRQDIEEILRNLRVVSFDELKEAYKLFKETNMLIAIENRLDMIYYQQVQEFTNRLPKRHGTVFRQFLETEIEIVNILTILRLKKAEFKAKDIEPYLILKGPLATNDFLKKLIDVLQLSDVFPLFEKSKFSKVIGKGLEELKEKNSLLKLELELYKYLLKEASFLQHQEPMSVDVILGFLLAKEIEVRNLRTLVKGKQVGFEDSQIEGMMVV